MAIDRQDRAAVGPMQSLNGRVPLQGINSDLDDLFLFARGSSLRAAVGDALLSANLARTMEGASSLTVHLVDPERRLLRSKLLSESHRLHLDGLAFALAAVGAEGRNAPLELTYEPLNVRRLRAVMGPHKAFRNKMTRAEFALARVREVKGPPIKFVCPQLHKKQPIETAKQSTAAKTDALQRRGKGLDRSRKYTVKTIAATRSQLDMAERVMRIAEHEHAPYRCEVALMEAMIVEGVMGNFPNILGVTPQTAAQGHISPNSVEDSVLGFLRGYVPGQKGVIEVFHDHPTWSAGQIAQEVQGSAFPERYDEYAGEAREFVDGYEGGGSSASSARFERYAFEQKANESGWSLNTRLAEEVNWEWFESAGIFYFVADGDLLSSAMRFVVSYDNPAIIDTSFKYDVGRKNQHLSVTCMAKDWAAPPGSVVAVQDHGVADGRYLVERIEAELGPEPSIATIELKRPTKALPEPTPSSSSTSFGQSGGTTTSPKTAVGAPQAIDTMLKRMEELVGTPYQLGGGHGGFTQNPSSLDCSGAMSDVLHAAGLISSPVTSGVLAGMYLPGKGDWLVIWANAAHVFCEIKTERGWIEWEEGGVKGDCGFLAAGSHTKSGFSARHPKGL